MPDYGGDKGFGSDKDDPGKDRNTGGNKPGQGSGYNTGNTNITGGGGGSESVLDDFSYRPTQTNYLGTQNFEEDFSSTSQDYDPSKHTNSIIEAIHARTHQDVIQLDCLSIVEEAVCTQDVRT